MKTIDYFETAKQIVREDAIKKGYIKEIDYEGRQLNYEAYIDGKRESESMDRNKEPY